MDKFFDRLWSEAGSLSVGIESGDGITLLVASATLAFGVLLLMVVTRYRRMVDKGDKARTGKAAERKAALDRLMEAPMPKAPWEPKPDIGEVVRNRSR